MPSVTFNGIHFTTKKIFGEYIRKRLYENGFGTFQEKDEQFSFYNELIKRHPRYNIIGEIRSVTTMPYVLDQNSIHMEITKINGEKTSISWVKCISGVIETEQQRHDKHLNEAMRNAISKSTRAFKRDSELICAECNVSNLPENKYHVDHHSPSFKKIHDDFIAIYVEPIEFDKDMSLCTHIFKDEDREWQRLWCEYHDAIATYQILCQTCNIQKH